MIHGVLVGDHRQLNDLPALAPMRVAFRYQAVLRRLRSLWLAVRVQ